MLDEKGRMVFTQYYHYQRYNEADKNGNVILDWEFYLAN